MSLLRRPEKESKPATLKAYVQTVRPLLLFHQDANGVDAAAVAAER